METESVAVAGDSDKQRQRRKKKSNQSRFLRNAKGFAKQGIYGRGTHIENDQYNYFINILDAMKNGFEDMEQKVNMSNNVFAQTKSQEIHLSSNQIVCKVLESLVGFVDASNLERFFDIFASNFRPICSDRFASHVLQKMIEIAFLRSLGKCNLKSRDEVDDDAESDTNKVKRAKIDSLSEEYYNLETEFTVEHKENCRQFVERTSKFMLNNLEDFLWDSCANHIMRTCVLCLAGVHVAKVAFEKGGAEIAKNAKFYQVPADWQAVMKEFPERLMMWPQFEDLPYDEHSSAFLGIICVALKAVDKNSLKHFGKKLLTKAFLKVDANANKKEKDEKKIELLDDNEVDSVTTIATEKANEECTTTFKLQKVFEHQCSVILLETLLTVAGHKLLIQLYAMLFAGRIATLAQKQLTNFAVQKLLQHVKEKDDFENIFTELANNVEELLKCGHTGVVAALAAACLRLATKQAAMVSALQAALHTAGDKETSKLFFLCMVKLKPSHALTNEDNTTFVHLHGSLIVQYILEFNKPIFLVNCILETDGFQLVSIFNTPNGSHIVDAFLQSKYIGEKSREKLIRQLEGFYIDLAPTKFGSRVVENLFTAAQMPQKTRIVKELAEKSNMLKSTPFGRLLHNKFRIETYRLSVAQWQSSLQHQKANKAEQLLKDFV